MNNKVKMVAATIGCICAAATSAAPTAEPGHRLPIELHFDMLADASPAATRAFAIAGTTDMLAEADWTKFMHMEMGDRGKVVKDAPYSAEAVTEATQMLSDGNRISRRTVALLYRDAFGRTRQEQTAPGHTVFINDPVAGKRTILNAEKKTATVLPDFRHSHHQPDIEKIRELARSKAKSDVIRRFSTSGDTEIIQSTDGAMIIRKSGDGETIIRRGPGGDAQILRRGPHGEEIVRRGTTGDALLRKSGDGETTEIIDEPGRRIVITRRETTKGDGTRAIEESKDVKISVVRAHPSDGAAAIAGLPHDINALVNRRTRHKGVTSSLGSKDFGGVRADGTQTITTIPAGEIGNDKPIQIVSEKWYSPELQAVVYSRHSDPRSGETIYRLHNIRRNAQPADLFAVPQGYTVKDRALSMAMPPMPPMPPMPAVPPVPAVPPAPPTR